MSNSVHKLPPKLRVVQRWLFRINEPKGARGNVAIAANDALKMKRSILSANIWEAIFEHGLRTLLSGIRFSSLSFNGCKSEDHSPYQRIQTQNSISVACVGTPDHIGEWIGCVDHIKLPSNKKCVSEFGI